MKKEFDLEYQYRLYLKRCAISEDQMGAVQRKETRQAFMGACGQILVLLRDEVGKLEDGEALIVLENMLGQVHNYFLKLTGKQN